MNQTILVTGATRGIGYATARRLIERGHTVFALGRDFSAFDLDGERCVRLPFDLRAVDEIHALCETLPPMDVLINNAAMLTAQAFESYSPQDRRDVLATNIEAPAELIRCLVPKMIARASDNLKIKGRVVNIASVAGFGGASRCLVRREQRRHLESHQKSCEVIWAARHYGQRSGARADENCHV